MAEAKESLNFKISRAARELKAMTGMSFVEARKHVVDEITKPKEEPNYDHVT